MAKLNDLSTATAISNDDIMHLRTTGGIDKKITGENLRNTLVTQVTAVATTQAISLSSYTTNLTLIGTQTAPITLTITNVLNNGREFKVINPTSFLMTITIGGETIFISQNGEVRFISNGSSMIIGRKNLTTITGNTSYSLNKGTRGKVFICEPTADMDLTLTDGGSDEREYVTVVNNSAYRVTVKDTSLSFYVDNGEQIDFNFDYAGNLKRSVGWGLVYDNPTNPAATVVLPAAMVDTSAAQYDSFMLLASSGTGAGLSYTGVLHLWNLGQNNYTATMIDSETSRLYWQSSSQGFLPEKSTWSVKKIWKWYS